MTAMPWPCAACAASSPWNFVRRYSLGAPASTPSALMCSIRSMRWRRHAPTSLPGNSACTSRNRSPERACSFRIPVRLTTASQPARWVSRFDARWTSVSMTSQVGITSNDRERLRRRVNTRVSNPSRESAATRWPPTKPEPPRIAIRFAVMIGVPVCEARSFAAARGRGQGGIRPRAVPVIGVSSSPRPGRDPKPTPRRFR